MAATQELKEKAAAPNERKENNYETLINVSEKVDAQQMMVHNALVESEKLEYQRINETARFNNNALREALEPKYTEAKNPVNLADIPPEKYLVKEDELLLPVKDGEKEFMDEEEQKKAQDAEKEAQ